LQSCPWMTDGQLKMCVTLLGTDVIHRLRAPMGQVRCHRIT